MKRLELTQLFREAEAYGGKTVTVCGWVRTLRSSKALGFIELNDGSCFKNLQVVFQDGQVENFKENEDDNDCKTVSTPVISMYAPIEEEGEMMMMAAEDIFIYGSIPVDLPNTKREELNNGKLELVLMYAIGSGARQKTESAGKIALGLKEGMLKDEQKAAYKSIKYLLFHYWSNPKAYLLTKEPVLVDRNNVPTEYLIRMEKEAVKYLLLDYNPSQSADLGNVNILKTQRRGEIRYLPFVTTIESIVDE